ncbi:Uncharacterized conserved protein [Anoxybacillus flavithermus WK1]|uniref:Uncharacterized conserved protein n=1 Tax=Anoxybacillus flavithermus (strain DSM 21510 / WK1) TaxID=491915 RepID=B7GI44_ANOFW|nr:Uncharacterized conserved protein [Anoxybacillus flavithermus WK1]
MNQMGKRKKDASKAGLSSPKIKGQGTTEHETGNIEFDSSRKKTKRM